MGLFGKKKETGNLTMGDYERFFDNTREMEDNSQLFNDVINAFDTYRDARGKEINSKNTKALSEAHKGLVSACNTYVKARSGAMSSSGKERLNMIRQLKEYQVNTNLKEDEERIFAAAYVAEKNYNAVKDAEITLETAKQITKANKDYQDAYKAARVFQRENLLSEGKRKDYASLESKAKAQEARNLDEVRDLKVLAEYRNQKWNQVEIFPIAKVEINGPQERVGANVSSRIRTEYNGKPGFFTETSKLDLEERAINRLFKKEAAMDLLDQYGKDVKAVVKESVSFNRAIYTVLSAWDNIEIPQGSAEQIKAAVREKQRIGNDFMDKVGYSSKFGKAMEQFFDKAKEFEETNGRLPDKDEKLGMFQAVIRENKELSPNMKKYMTKEQDFLSTVSKPLVNNDTYERTFRQEFLERKAAVKGTDRKAEEKRREYDRMLQMSGQIKETARIIKSTEIAMDGAPMEEGSNLTNRNIATSRMAELLGVGNLVAHSRKMEVTINGKKTEGCFMDFAEGIDPSTKDPEKLRMFQETEPSMNAGLNKDAASIAIFDYICGQTDRHGGNMFYKLSEPDKVTHKRNIIGLQGIDNDLAFTSVAMEGINNVKFEVKMGKLQDMTFIDSELADKIRKLDRDAVEFAIGDLIPKNQIDNLMTRLDMVKDHMAKNMVEIDSTKENAWELNEYSEKAEKTKTDDLENPDLKRRKENYLRGRKLVEDDLTAIYAWNARGKIGIVAANLAGIKRTIANMEKEALETQEKETPKAEAKAAEAPSKEAPKAAAKAAPAPAKEAQKPVQPARQFLGRKGLEAECRKDAPRRERPTLPPRSRIGVRERSAENSTNERDKGMAAGKR